MQAGADSASQVCVCGVLDAEKREVFDTLLRLWNISQKFLRIFLTIEYSEIIFIGMRRNVKLGRPPKPPAELYSAQANVKMTQAERALLDAEARKRGLSLSALLMSPWRESWKKRQEARRK